jgi:hypothetical protein
MKTFVAFILLSSTAFASEIQRVDSCTSYRNQADRIQSDITRISYEMAREHQGHEYSESIEIHAANCEEVPSNYAVLNSQRTRLEKDLERVREEIKEYCPRSRPE